MSKDVYTEEVKSRVLTTEQVNWRRFEFLQQDDFKELPPEAKTKLKKSIIQNEFTQPFYIWRDEAAGINYCMDGKHRILILEELAKEGIKVPELLPATFIYCRNKKEAARLVLTYSSIYAKITSTGMFDFMQMYELDYSLMKDTIDLPSFDTVDYEAMINDPTDVKDVIAKSLQEQFIIPPFSIFDTRQGYWQERKTKWNSLFDSQKTRENVELIAQSGQSPAIYELRNKMRKSLGREPEWNEIIEYARKKGLHIYEGASVFDPVLCEVVYAWFCTNGGSVLDPFAGGSVRGIVAALIGHHYTGIDLRPEQVETNKQQATKLNVTNANWIAGDSRDMDQLITDNSKHDFVFSCPPYHDLEQYSEDPRDLSNMNYEEFREVYTEIIKKSVARLNDNRFACFVVGEIRDKEGFYRDFVGDTVKAFRAAGMQFYNEIILVNVAGSLPVRIGRQFGGYRKVGKMHQNVLVFYKGDTKKIKEEFPQIKVDEYFDSSEPQPNIAM